MLTERDLAVLHALARYYVLSREQISRLCFPADKSGRITRRRLQTLLDAGLINRTNAPLYNPRGGDPWPAYFPAKRGGEYLAEVTGDDRFLAVPFQTPFSQHLEHWIAIAETHIALETAIARQSVATLDGWVNEWDTVNPDEAAPEKRFRLYTLIQPQPRLV
ncbi:MAG: replication-relaxation family protein, partial [Planctomycetales bacterium]|nr:replication-relaxation family protein [Planctomycetales bacterium]